ncbi:right-handed parallel beta-helix repeat-containing protein [Saprospiraceae bacterium]|nr:right-handed parallel beta-helix repeat-containing protein [Saprospiraceae bacterium]
MKFICQLIIVLLLCISCSNEIPTYTIEPGTIEDRVFNATILIDGHEFDGSIIRNCTFENIDGDGLQLRDVDDLCIENCIFRDISEDAIRFRNSGTTDQVKISNNEIYNIKQNGILASEGHRNTMISGNKIYNVATSNVASQFGAPHHGVYFQGFNVSITDNEIYDIINDQGNCISIRSYGSISRNRLSNATDHGISYFSDHPANDLNLVIENNMIFDNGKRAINLASDGNSENHIGSCMIKFNTLLSADKSPIGIDNELSNTGLEITANILIRTDAGAPYIFTDLTYSGSDNITESNDIGFVNFTERDLHISASSMAVNGVSNTSNIPPIDFDGDLRTINVDVGADEVGN